MSIKSKKYDGPSITDIEGTFVNNSSLLEIDRYLKRFNPIKVMKMEHMEIRHSAILRWLLDPSETHGLDDSFLKVFLGHALRGYHYAGSVTALEIATADLRDSVVRAEWNNIDLFIYCDGCGLDKDEKWTFIIENKFHSKQYQGQLKQYRDKIESHFDVKEAPSRVSTVIPKIKVTGIFLTLSDEALDESSFTQIYYEDIVQLLGALMESLCHKVTSEVRIFISHYLNILKEATGMSEEQQRMERLARELYHQHKDVLNFVIEHGVATDFAMAVRRIFGNIPDTETAIKISQLKYFYNNMGEDWVDIYPEKWVEKFDGDAESGFDYALTTEWEGEYPLICWFKLNQNEKSGKESGTGELYLHAGVAPFTNLEHRQELVDRVVRAGQKLDKSNIHFSKRVKINSNSFMKFFKNNTLQIDDTNNSEEIENKMKILLLNFEPEINSIAKQVSDFYKYGKISK